MPKSKTIKLKTAATATNVYDFLASVSPERLRADCMVLLDIFTEVTAMPAKMWGPSIIGFGEYTYHRSNGAQGSYLATGFSPRKVRHSR